MPIKDAVFSLLYMHAKLFGAEQLSTITTRCKISVKSESELARALWEWLYFGLYVFVEGIQNNFPHSDDVGVGIAVARGFLQEFENGLQRSGLDSAALAIKQREIDDRIRRYEKVATSRGPERLGFAVAGSVLGLSISPGSVPPSMDAYEFSTVASQVHISSLRAVNDFFLKCTMIP
jgi:hypothetical protein